MSNGRIRGFVLAPSDKAATPVEQYLEAKVVAPRTRKEMASLTAAGAVVGTGCSVEGRGELDSEGRPFSPERQVRRMTSKQLRGYFKEAQKEQMLDLDELFCSDDTENVANIPKPPAEGNTFRGRGYRSPPKGGRVITNKSKINFQAPRDRTAPTEVTEKIKQEYQGEFLPSLKKKEGSSSSPARSMGMNIWLGEENTMHGGPGLSYSTTGESKNNLRVVALLPSSHIALDSDLAAGISQSLYQKQQLKEQEKAASPLLPATCPWSDRRDPKSARGRYYPPALSSSTLRIHDPLSPTAGRPSMSPAARARAGFGDEPKKVTAFEIRRFQQRQESLKSAAYSLHKKKVRVRSHHYPPTRETTSPVRSKAARPPPTALEAWKMSCGLIDSDRTAIDSVVVDSSHA